MTTEHAYTRSEIRCDTDSCSERLVVERDISEEEAAVIALAALWSVQHGSQRDYHHCPKCKERDDG